MSGRKRMPRTRKRLKVARRRVYRRIATFVDRAAAAAVFHILSVDPSTRVREPDRLFHAPGETCEPDGRGYCVRCHRIIEED